MPIDQEQIRRDQGERINRGRISKDGLASEFGQQVLIPTIQEIFKEITDITTIDVTSDKKASIEVLGRKWAASKISEILVRINGYIADAETTERSMSATDANKEDSLYRIK